ncbi:MAG: hypothetical protein BWY65_00067 [Firmicutes bacterium ADurb.Bin373]|nr:DUF456 family protein [Bacillota bacterium]OQA11271.1 MAG: hypothetical protein BWY65_00067 [Firmicutes bacterium ADurb.Bin373]
MSIIGMIIAVLFFIAGIAGTVLPVLPGAPLIWLGMLLYGLIAGFHNLPWTFFLGQGLAVALIFFVDYFAGVWGVRRYGGSKEAVWGSVTGALLGLILMGPFGLIFGPFLGAVAGELYLKNTLEKAFRVGVGTLIGFFGGFVLKLAIEIVMIVWFFMAVF